MKTIIIAVLIALPGLIVFNESGSFFPNILGIAYIALLYMASKTRPGQRFCQRLFSESERINKRLFN